MNNPFEKIMQQAKSFQETMQKFQSELKMLQATGEAGAGMVKVVMDGHYHIQSIEIEDEVYQEGKGIVASLIVAAEKEAAKKIKQIMEEKMTQYTKNLGLPSNFTFPFMPS